MNFNIEKNFDIKNNSTIIIGCSGGPDSMALLYSMLELSSKKKLTLIVSHINHNVREESLEEMLYVKTFCEKKSLIFESMIVEEYGDDNFENEARNIRYNFYNKLMKKYAGDYLMTAHHADDLIETIMMKIVRGTNLLGYAGFKKEIEVGGYKVLRPLIYYTKDEIIEYLEKNKIEYYIDKTNDSDNYTRNRFRKNMLPFLKKEDKNVHTKFIKYSELLIDTYKYIEKERNKALKKVEDANKINLEEFKKIDSYLQREIFNYLLSEFYQDDLILINSNHVDLLIKLVYSKKANSIINLPNDVIASKEYNFLEIKKNIDEISNYEIELNEYISLANNHYIKKIAKSTLVGNDIIRIDSSEVTLPLIVRTRKIGDKISLKGTKGGKKVKDIFIDLKVNVNLRDSWPVVMDSKGIIIWIPNLKKSKYDKNQTEKYDIILKYE